MLQRKLRAFSLIQWLAFFTMFIAVLSIATPGFATVTSIHQTISDALDATHPSLSGSGFGQELIANSGFEQFGELNTMQPEPGDTNWTSSRVPPGWSFWRGRNTQGQGVWTSEDAYTGQFSVKIFDADVAVGFVQRMPVEPGDVYVASAFVRAQTTGTITLHINVFNEDPSDGVYAAQHREILAEGITDGWVPLYVVFEIPEGANEIQLVTDVRGQEENEFVYWDDVSIRQVITGDESVVPEGPVPPAVTWMPEDSSQFFPVVVDGQPIATIVAASDNNRVVGEFNGVLHKMSGVYLPIDFEGSQQYPYEIHIGQTDYVRSLSFDWGSIDVDGIIIRTIEEEGGYRKLIVAGSVPHSTEFAVYRLLHKYAGVRWYMPTDLGEHVPKQSTFILSEIDDVEEPDFLSRRLSAVSRYDGGEWERRNLLRQRISSSHNLWTVFTPEVYDEHPEWFPIVGGERLRPLGTNSAESRWQPCMSNPDAARYAGQVAARYFYENPDELAFSLSINDNVSVLCEEDLALIEPGKTYRGYTDLSDVVFTFLNRAAEELVKTHPDKYISALAYHISENAPSFQLHPNVIPSVTSDRGQWYDPDFMEEDRELMRRWSETAAQWGVYDYYYGAGYVIPRYYPHLIGESIQYAKELGVIRFVSETYSNWSLDGHKGWIAAQLLWDADQSVDELLHEFYCNFFQEAASPMRQYFELMEKVWMEQPLPAKWINYFFNLEQISIFLPDDIREARQLLNEALEMADSDLTRRRVEIFSEGFHYTELYAEIYYLMQRLSTPQIKTIEDFHLVAEGYLRYPQAIRDLHSYYDDVMMPNILHRPAIPFEERSRTRLDGAVSVSTIMYIKVWADDNARIDLAKEFLENVRQAYAGQTQALFAAALLQGYSD